VERRALLTLGVGIAGAALGVAAAAAGVRLLGLVAGLAALTAGALSFGVATRLARAKRTVDLLQRDRDAAQAMADVFAARAQAVTESLVEAEAALADAEDAERRGPESVFDPETGLLDERVFVVSFERKVAAARRHLRPLCLVLIDLGSGLPSEPPARASALRRFGATVRETLRDADIACRLGPNAFGLILEDTPESGGVWAAERLQIAVACAGRPPTRLVAAVATYPNHGLASQEVLLRAQEALERARASTDDGMGPVEVASVDLS